MRLLYVSHSFPPRDRPLENVGGMQRVATELHAALLEHPALELRSVVLRSSWRWTHMRMVPFTFRLLRELGRQAGREGVEAVLFSSMVTAALALPTLRRLDRSGIVRAAIPVGRDVTLPVAPYQRLVPRVFRSLDAVFPISRATAAECAARGATADQLRVVPCGVEATRFAAPEDRAAARQELMQAVDPPAALPGDALLLCSVGRHVERKGFAWFVDRVMPRLPDHVHFWLAGEGPRTPVIREAVARHGLENRVRLLGRVPDAQLARLLRGADLFVMPNRPVAGDMEGFGVVMLEANVAGLPVVAADLEGIRDVIREGVNGHLVASGDADAFGAAVLRYAAAAASLPAASRGAVAYATTNFAWPAIADRYVQELQRIHRRKRAEASARSAQPHEPAELGSRS